MLSENNKVKLEGISPENPFPSNQVCHFLKIMYWELDNVPAEDMTPEKLIELGQYIKWLACEVEQKVTQWKELV